MPVTGAMQFGGSAYLAVSAADTTILWGAERRLHIINPTVGGPPIVRLDPVDGPEFRPDHGVLMWIVANASGSNDFSLRDAEGHVSKTVGVGEAALVSRYFIGGAPRFFAELREYL